MSPLPPTQPPTPPHSCSPSLDKEGTEPAGLWCLFALEEVGPISPLPAELPSRASPVGRGLSQRGHLCQVTDGHLRSLPGLSPALSLFRTAELCPRPHITPPVCQVPLWALRTWQPTARSQPCLGGHVAREDSCFPFGCGCPSLGHLLTSVGLLPTAEAPVSCVHPGPAPCLWALASGSYWTYKLMPSVYSLTDCDRN